MKRLILASLLILSFSAVSSTSFFYYTKDHRILVLKRLYEATKHRYSLWDIKLINMEISGDDIFQQALKAEALIEDVEGPIARAKSNILFHDRVTKLIASFKDTHFKAKANVPLPKVINGLRLNPYKRTKSVEVLVTGISQKIMAYNNELGAENIYSKIKLGDKVIAINGISVQEHIKTLKSHTAGSSDLFQTYSAIDKLSDRNFLYPEKNYSDWTFSRITDGIKKKFTIRIPWFVDKTDRADARIYFSAKQFPFLKQMHFTWDEEQLMFVTKNDLKYKGYRYSDAPKNLLEQTDWYKDEENVTARTGYFEKDKKKYGYIQFFQFTNTQLYTKDDLDARENPNRIKNIFTNFVLELKKKKLPLIVDLRTNFGGSTAIAIENLASVAKEDESYPSRTVVYKTTSFIQSLASSEGGNPATQQPSPYYLDFQMIIDEIFHAVSLNKKYSNVLLYTDPITAHEKVKGYEEPVVALISPWCISACDNQAFLFKSSKRVTLIGEPANGTGAGFFSNQYHTHRFTDPLFVLSIRIPNYLFGLPMKSTERSIPDPDMSLTLKTNSENKPTTPHVKFKSTRKTYSEGSYNWILKAISTINNSNPAQQQNE